MADKKEADMQIKLSMTWGDLKLVVPVPASMFTLLSHNDVHDGIDIQKFKEVVEQFVEKSIELIKAKGNQYRSK